LVPAGSNSPSIAKPVATSAAPAAVRAPGRRWIVWPAAAVVAVGAIAIFRGATRVSSGDAASGDFGKFYTVTPVDLDIKVRKDGELQAVNNTDVLCQVEGRSTIVYLVKEGEAVKKGDLLVELDSSTLRQSLETATLEVKQAESDLKNSREMLAIQENQNQADLEAAQVALDLAKLALEQYEKGTYPQDLSDAQTLVKMTEITVRNKEEDLEQTRSLFAKGFVTAADVKQAELSVTTVHNDLRKAQTALMVLTTFKHQTETATARSALSQAEQKFARVKRMNASMLTKAQADVETKEMAVSTKSKNLQKLHKQLEYCKIFAPADGMVVYGRDDDEFRMVEGAQVRERQRLIRLPDTSQMKALVKINESQVPRLKIGQRALVRVVGTPDPVGATITKISPMADGSSRWWNPDLREYPVELTLDQSPRDTKPGLSAQVEIFIDQMHDALAVPLASIYSQGRESYVFARRGENVEPVKVQIGAASETHATVPQGLKSGQDVLILAAGQGRQLLERAGIDTSAALAGGDGGAGERGPGPAPKGLKLDTGRSRSGRPLGPEGAKASAEASPAPSPKASDASPEKQAPVAAAPAPSPAHQPLPAAPTPANHATVAPAVGKTAAPAKPLPSPISAVDPGQH
jgi:HlyD family secretion protein